MGVQAMLNKIFTFVSEKKEILIISSIVSAIANFMNILFVPFLILIGLNIVDYSTGVMAAPYRKKKIDSKIGFLGIKKKICFWYLVGIGCVFDWGILFSRQLIGVESPKLVFVCATFICVWLSLNEIISILENMTDMGVKFPKFMLRWTKKLKSQVEKKAEEMFTDKKE